jgi:hypothetical protein
MLPVSLAVPKDDTVVRYHIAKFQEPLSEPVSLASWDGMKVTFCVNARADVIDPTPRPAGLDDEDRHKRDKALGELAKSELLLEDTSGQRVYHGKPLSSAGNFAIIQKTANGYSLAVVREWFEFTKKSKFKAMNIDEAESHLQELQRKSVIDATDINRKLARFENRFFVSFFFFFCLVTSWQLRLL